MEEIPDLRELGEERAAAIDAWLRDHWGLFRVPGGVEPVPDDDTRYLDEIAAAPVSKVGGHPAWIQDPVQRRCACGTDMEYLLTLASSDADPSRWRAGDRADEGSALDRSMRSLFAASLGGDATAAEEATSPEEAQAVVERALASNPNFLAEVGALLNAALDGDADSLAGLPPSTELMLGDLGSVYVFSCRHCEASPVDAELQMT